MHEMSITQSLIDIITQEMAKHGLTKLITVTVKHGRLSQVVPEALEMAFEVLTLNTALQGAVIVCQEIPLKLECAKCKLEFSPSENRDIFVPCPGCQTEVGHRLLSGRELYIDSLEAE